MADYIYLLSTRLTSAQQAALENVREAARAHGMTVFLIGGAVRDLTSGSPIRDLDMAVQGNAMDLKDEIAKVGGVLIGQDAPSQALYFNFPRGVRLEVGSTLSAAYPKPGKPEYSPASILDDLRRRDFTANAMAISLNDGSYGLLMDPLNGVADIENRELRLVSNYGFLEDPARLIRAARFSARFGWQMEEKTQQRYENAKAEEYIGAMTPAQAGYELEEIFHEEDPLRVLRRLESEGWAKTLFPVWTSAKANETELNRLRDVVGQLEAMGIHPDPSPAYFPLLTAKLNPKEVASLKSSFARQGFVDQIAALEGDTKTLATQFSSRAAAAPSDAWRMLFASAPEPVLWLAHTTRSASLQAKFKAFFNDWSQARHKIPYQLMQEMRITPELPGYNDLLEQLFFAIMDGKLETAEASKAFLEPFSPPAPPPPPNLRRRPVKRESKAAKPRSKKAVESEPVELHGDGAPAEVAPPAQVDTPPGTSKPEPGKIASQSATHPVAAKTGIKSVAPTTTQTAAKSASKEAAKAPTKSAPAPEQPVKPVAKAPEKPAAKPHAEPTAVAKPGAPKASSKPVAKPAAGIAAKTAGTAAVKTPAKAAASSPSAKRSPQHAAAAKKTTAAHSGKATPAAKSQGAVSAKTGAKGKAGAAAPKSSHDAHTGAATHKPSSASHHKGAKPAAKPTVKPAAKTTAKPAAKAPAKPAAKGSAKSSSRVDSKRTGPKRGH